MPVARLLDSVVPLDTLTLFSRVARKGSLSAAARELGLTTAAVSKRLTALEARLGVRLLNRTTRSVVLTEEGEAYLEGAERVLHELRDLEARVSSRRAAPRGLIRVNSSFGFGRRYIAPAIADFVRLYPEVQVQLQLTERYLNLPGEGFDLGIRFGELRDSSLFSRRLMGNRRLLCAAPSYLRRYGEPKHPSGLARHNCLVIRENDAPFGHWRFSGPGGAVAVKVRGTLTCNDGEVAHAWAVAGLGIVLRSQWDVADSIRAGILKPLLEDYRGPDADVVAVFPYRHNLSPRVRVLVDYLRERFSEVEADFP
jgi:DNA-binding transcriptional LysR family regulator